MTTKSAKQAVSLQIPIVNAEEVRVQYRYDVGGQHPPNCCETAFTEDVAPQNQLHFRFTKAAVSFSPWIMNEGFRLLDIFLPETFEPRSTIRV